jgi:hypothetical protein
VSKYIVEHHWGCCEDDGIGVDMDEYETIEEARKHAVKGDRILEIIEEIK